MQWEGICEFVAVAQTGSFTKAAKQLKLSTAQVSRQVKALEKRLEITLLYRTTRQVSLTQAGEIYASECQNILNQLIQAQSHITQMSEHSKGHIKISAPTAYGERHIAPLINDFCLAHPNISIELVLTNQKIDLTRDKIDLAIRLGQLQDSSIRAKKIRDRKVYLCASKSYLEKYGTPQNLTELKSHHCLLGSLGYWRFFLPETQKQQTFKLKGQMICNNGFVLLDAVKKGLGIAQLPDYYVEESLRAGDICAILDDYQPKQDGVWAIYPNAYSLAPTTRYLLNYLEEKLPKI